jgi:hypothetical protein
VGADGKANTLAVANEVIDIFQELETMGAEEIKSDKRWLSPYSDSGSPGIIVFEGSSGLIACSYHGNDEEWMVRGKSGCVADVANIHIHNMIKGGEAKSFKAAIRILSKTLELYDPKTGEVFTVNEWNNRLLPVEDENEVDRRNDVGGTIQIEPLPDQILAPRDRFGDLVRALERTQWKPNLMTANQS